MRGAVLGLLACAGCDGVFGINPVPLPDDAAHVIDMAPHGDGAPADVQPVDGSTVGSIRLVLPPAPSVFVDDMKTLAVSTHGPPNAMVMLSATSTVGSISPGLVARTLDANGLDSFDFQYTAPSSPASEQLSFAVSSGSLMDIEGMSFTVSPLTAVGYDLSELTAQTSTVGQALGLRVTTASQVTVRDVGFYTTTSGAHVKVGVYNVMSLTPYQLQTSGGPQAVVVGRNIVPVTPVTLPAGQYWIVVTLDAATMLEYRAGNTELYGASNYPYASGMPAIWGATWNDIGGSSFEFFMLVE